MHLYRLNPRRLQTKQIHTLALTWQMHLKHVISLIASTATSSPSLGQGSLRPTVSKKKIKLFILVIDKNECGYEELVFGYF